MDPADWNQSLHPNKQNGKLRQQRQTAELAGFAHAGGGAVNSNSPYMISAKCTFSRLYTSVPITNSTTVMIQKYMVE